MSQVPQRVSPYRRLIDMIWQQPIWALGFAVFFGTLFGANREAYLQAYKYSLVFAYSIGLALWLTRYSVVPRLPVAPGADTPSAFLISLSYGSISLAASYAAA